MRFIVDHQHPYLDDLFSSFGTLVRIPGRLISAADVREADVLLIRSVTRVDRALLQGSQLKFIGSLSAGEDHVDLSTCKDLDIPVAFATGCNAEAVAQYVRLCLRALQVNKGRAAVVGVGQVGSRVARDLKAQGFAVMTCDPLRVGQAGFIASDLDELCDLDVICLHTPLTHSGPYPTYHLIDEEFMQRQKPGCVIVSAGRGAVVDFAALKTAGAHLRWCLDVWENEPVIDPAVLAQAAIATPHIAGHTVQSKWNAAQIIHQAFCDFFKFSSSISVNPTLQTARPFNILQVSSEMKKMLQDPHLQFDELRKKAGDRPE